MTRCHVLLRRLRQSQATLVPLKKGDCLSLKAQAYPRTTYPRRRPRAGFSIEERSYFQSIKIFPQSVGNGSCSYARHVANEVNLLFLVLRKFFRLVRVVALVAVIAQPEKIFYFFRLPVNNEMQLQNNHSFQKFFKIYAPALPR